MPAFRVKLGTNDLNCVDVPLNPTHSLKLLLLMYCVHFCRVFYVQANAIGRSAKTVREFLEKHFSEEQVATERGTIKLALKALLEVVQSGSKNMEVAVMRRREPLRVRKLCQAALIGHNYYSNCCRVEPSPSHHRFLM